MSSRRHSRGLFAGSTSRASSMRHPTRVVLAAVLAVMLVQMPGPAHAFFGKSKAAATDDAAITGDPEVVTEAVTDELIATNPAAVSASSDEAAARVSASASTEFGDDVGHGSATKKVKRESILEMLHVPHPFSSSGTSKPSIDEKHPGATNPLKYVDLEPPAKVKSRNKVLQYPVCNRAEPNLEGTTVNETKSAAKMLRNYVVGKLKLATTFNAPFKSSTYFCNLLPKKMYADLTTHFPPDKAFSNYASKQKACNSYGCRYAMDIGGVIGDGKKTVKPSAIWPQRAKAVRTWKGLRDVLFSKDFESALWQKLGVTSRISRREIRIFSDKSGQSNGRVHTDQVGRCTLNVARRPPH